MPTKIIGAKMTSQMRTTDYLTTWQERNRSLSFTLLTGSLIDHEACISAGSVEICRASFILDVVGEVASSEAKLTVEGKLDTCGSVSLSHSSLLQDVKDCRKHGLKKVVLSGIGG